MLTFDTCHNCFSKYGISHGITKRRTSKVESICVYLFEESVRNSVHCSNFRGFNWPICVQLAEEIWFAIIFFFRSATNNICGCEQHRLGVSTSALYRTNSNSKQLLEPSRSGHVDQLERAQSSLSCTADAPSSEEYANSAPNAQHNLDVLHEQARWNTVSSIDAVSNQFMEMVPSKGYINTVSTHRRSQQPDCGLRVSSTIPQEQLNDPPDCIPTTPTSVRQKRFERYAHL